jgi:hypothetical protein
MTTKVRGIRQPLPAMTLIGNLGSVPAAASPVTVKALASAIVAQPPAVPSTVPNFTDNVVPTGTINGSNAVFTLPSTPNPAGSLQLFRNGVLQTAGMSADYTLSAATITYNAAPITGDTHVASYRH